METIRTTYTGDLRTEAIHVKSQVKIFTDAPPDNQGKGESFSPTDLLAASLGSCMATLMGIAARTHGINIDHMDLSITKIMAANPRRVAEVQIEFTMPEHSYSEKEKAILIHAAETCPVALSLHPDLKQSIQFHWK
ncbi:MAG: OsmC family protein [Bacteroidetes bacterium]|nr:OsmC family protein [Bacteroidota bacterium]MBP6402490.1 OsmC family protein [Bacteroidia bacterium]MBK6838806.1 OsmC family protein [Bacteroidota bacterium]MBK9542894.1 OsmC family protein [Bacteroidota bacterium]MBL0257170.1 OsmC family protein [Bacteroidota bacterium]